MDDDPSKVERPLGGTRLVQTPTTLQVLTWDQLTDCRGALTRAVKEYIEHLSVTWEEGRVLKWMKAEEDWADAEDDADFPGFCVYTIGDGQYDGSNMSPSPLAVKLADGSTRYIMQVAEFSVPVRVECWFTDSVARTGLMKGLEDMFAPVDWMYGFRLMLPHYNSVHATFEPISSMYLDTAENVNRRWRVSAFTLQANIPQIKQRGKIGNLDPRNTTNITRVPV